MAPSLLYGPTLTSIHDYWKDHSLTGQTFVGKVMSLLFNMLSRLVIAFLPRSKRLLISWLQSLSTVILESKKVNAVLHPTNFCGGFVDIHLTSLPRLFFGRNEAKAETPVLWPPRAKS